MCQLYFLYFNKYFTKLKNLSTGSPFSNDTFRDIINSSNRYDLLNLVKKLVHFGRRLDQGGTKTIWLSFPHLTAKQSTHLTQSLQTAAAPEDRLHRKCKIIFFSSYSTWIQKSRIEIDISKNICIEIHYCF